MVKSLHGKNATLNVSDVKYAIYSQCKVKAKQKEKSIQGIWEQQTRWIWIWDFYTQMKQNKNKKKRIKKLHTNTQLE